MDFEELLLLHGSSAERFVKFRVPSSFDAEDVLQEVYFTAYTRFSQLKNTDSFKPWLISIARNKCSDYFREKARQMDIPIDSLSESVLVAGRNGVTEQLAVRDTLESLGDKDKQMLYLYYWKELPQNEIAERLGVPLGTVKSRLHSAKQHFREKYPYPKKQKGEKTMKKMPGIMPEYKITKVDAPPFPVRWEEVMGWFIIPKLGERLSWAMYDFPERERTEYMDLQVTGRVEVHGIEGVEIDVREYEPVECNVTDNPHLAERTLVAQLTDTHCRVLAETHMQNGVKRCYTFLDGDAFLNNWGFGEDNCGNEVNVRAKGDITRSGNEVTTADKEFLLDVVGRYTVEICGKSYDCICVMDVETYDSGVCASEQFLDENGRTVLWRRFNRDDWAFDRYRKKWSEMLPDNERLTINGRQYVHWYDCITSYIL